MTQETRLRIACLAIYFVGLGLGFFIALDAVGSGIIHITVNH